jgi:Fe-Mn family superoxide dismutase
MFKLPELPYSLDALEPHIDAKTMEIHHDKHHQAYVDKLNAAIEGTEFADMDIVDVLKDIAKVPEEKRQAVINHGGGHANHTFFWEIMTPGGSSEPTGKLAEEIKKTFGNFEDFKTKFVESATTRFGSGWAWLVKDDAGNLEMYSTANQDSPIMQGHTPLLGVDVWEHAYYLKYQNKRPDYLAAWWNVVNWDKVSQIYEA